MSFFLKTASTFFKLSVGIEDIDTYQMAKTASKLIHFFRSYSPKTGLMTSSFGPKFNRDKNSMGQGHYTVILRWNGWELDVFIIKGSGKCGGFCICDFRSLLRDMMKARNKNINTHKHTLIHTHTHTHTHRVNSSVGKSLVPLAKNPSSNPCRDKKLSKWLFLTRWREDLNYFSNSSLRPG